MHSQKIRERGGFTLIEVAVVLGVLGAVLLVAGTMLTQTIEAYSKVASQTDTIKQARHCLEMISREIRESVNFDIQSQAAGAPLATVTDALLLTSARLADNPATADPDNAFVVDASGFPVPQSIILFYLNATPEGITQLVKHQLYYFEDLNIYTPPFRLLNPSPYVGANIVILDNNNLPIAINRNTGAVGAAASFSRPRILMNGSTSFDMINDGINPIEARITCQVTDQHGRSVATRLRTQIEPRNI